MKIRKRILASVCALVFALCDTGCGASDAENYKDVLNGNDIADVFITISNENLNDMLEYAANEEYHSADVEIGGVKVENAGIRTKGNLTLNSTVRSDSDRYSYRIKFNKYVKGGNYLGLDELCLNNCYMDTTYMREYLHYEALKYLGVSTPETEFCRVYINGELQGLYLAVEAIDDTYLEETYGKNYNSGSLYKMEKGASLKYEDDEQYSYAELKKGVDDEKSGLKKLIKTLNNISDVNKGDIESVLDVGSALKYIAANTVLCNYDSYNGNMMQNYYLYQDENGVFSVIPWDFNMSFGGFDGNNSEIGIDTPISSGNISDYPLIDKLLSVDEYKKEYYSYIEKLLEYLDGFEERVGEVKALIKNDVKNDPTAFYTYEQFDAATEYQSQNDVSAQTGVEKMGRGFGGGSIINCIKSRVENIKKQLSGDAEKTTQSKNFGGHGLPGSNNSRPNGMGQPPKNSGEKQDGMGQPPKNSGEKQDGMGQPSENSGEKQDGMGQPPENSSEKQDGMGQPPQNIVGKPDSREKMPDKIRVNVNGNILSFEKDPYIEDGRTLVPMRKILEALGLEVEYEDGKITVSDSETTVLCNVGDNKAYVNGKEYTLDVPVATVGDRAFVPVRFISECFGFNVEWTEKSQLIEIIKKKNS